MTIDEAIKHTKNVASEQMRRSGECIQEDKDCDKYSSCIRCSEEHEQLAKWLTQLKEYQKLEEQGRLIKLPCKVGDAVYVKMASYCNAPYAEAEVRDFTHFTSCGFCVVVTSNYFHKQNIPFTEFGKTVFLTKEEAEKDGE